jgi:hypothetical protein
LESNNGIPQNKRHTPRPTTARHRDLRNILIYINLEKAIFQNADEEYHVKVAETLQEACKLLEVGFEYVTDLNGAKLFRKRK